MRKVSLSLLITVLSSYHSLDGSMFERIITKAVTAVNEAILVDPASTWYM